MLLEQVQQNFFQKNYEKRYVLCISVPSDGRSCTHSSEICSKFSYYVKVGNSAVVIGTQWFTGDIRLRRRTPRGNSWQGISAISPLTPVLNPSAQGCLTRFFTGDFASWTVHFFNIWVKNQQMQQLFIHFINNIRWLLHVSALQLSISQNAPWGWQCNAETCRSYHT
jgi:hypothetical protein